MQYPCHFKNGLLFKRHAYYDIVWPCSFMQIYLFSHKNNKVNNWSQEIYVITSFINFERIKGKENIIHNSLSRVWTLGLYKGNLPKKEHEYGQSIFDSETETVCNIENSRRIIKTLQQIMSSTSLMQNM